MRKALRFPYRSSGKPITVDGVMFESWAVGILRYERRSLDGRLMVHQNYRRPTYTAAVDGLEIGSLFRSMTSAMRAAITIAKAKGEK